ncbi:MAG: PqqD family protein [Rhizomicrobium sp.]
MSTHPDILFSTIGDEIVLMSVQTGKYYGLDPIGADIWQRMLAPVCVAALCAGLADTYDAPSDEISQDVTGLLERLLADGLIVLVSDPVAA